MPSNISGSIVCFVACLSVAATVNSAALEEIVVTAQKREQSLQDVPIAISALSAEQISNLGLQTGKELQAHTPGLIWAGTSHVGKPELFLRGVGFDDFQSSTGSPVALYNDNVVYGALTGASMQLFDLERVEVLKGPQGTLWGKNTTGGLIHVIPKKPEVGEETNGYATFTAAEYGELVFEGAVGGSLSDTTAARISVKRHSFDGYMRSINPLTEGDINGYEWHAIRGQLAWEPTEKFRARLAMNYSDLDGDGTMAKLIGGNQAIDPTCTNPFEINSTCPDDFGNFHGSDIQVAAPDIVGHDKPKNLTTALHLEYETNWGTLTSVTSIQDVTRDLHTGEGTPGLLLNSSFEDDYEGFTQEIRFFSDSTLPFAWTAGLYYQKDDMDSFRGDIVFGFQSNGRHVIVDSTIFAAFFDASFEVSDRLTIDAGLRVTSDEREATFEMFRSFVPPAPEVVLNRELMTTDPTYFTLVPLESKSRSWTEPSARFSLTYALTDDVNFFATVSRGFRGGEPNAGAQNIGEFSISDREILTAYEAGIKGKWLDNSLGVNASAFYYDYDDKIIFLEVPPNPPLTLSNTLAALNGNTVDVKGVEVEINWQATDNLAFDLAATWTEGEYKEVDSTATVPFSGGVNPSGNKLENLPEVTLNAALRYTYPLSSGASLFFNLDAVWWDDYFQNLINDDFLSQEAFWRFGASVGYVSPDEQWKVKLYGKNLTDEEYFTDGFLFGGRMSWFGDPQVFGATVSYEF